MFMSNSCNDTFELSLYLVKQVRLYPKKMHICCLIWPHSLILPELPNNQLVLGSQLIHIHLLLH